MHLAAFAYNNTYHITIGRSPFYALHVYDPNFAFNVEDAVIKEGDATTHAAQIRDEQLQLSDRIRTAREYYKKFYDQKHQPQRFHVG